MNKKTLIFGTALAVVCLGSGFLGGYFFQAAKVEKVCNLKDSGELIGEMSSAKILTTFSVLGKVTAIEGKNITLNDSNNLRIPIMEDADITSLTSEKTDFQFSDVKKGDSVNVTLRLLSNGKSEGIAVMVVPIYSNQK